MDKNIKNKHLELLIQENINETIREIEDLYVLLLNESFEDVTESLGNWLKGMKREFRAISAPFHGIGISWEVAGTFLLLGGSGSDLIDTFRRGSGKTAGTLYIIGGLFYIIASCETGGDEKFQLFVAGFLYLLIGGLYWAGAASVPAINTAIDAIKSASYISKFSTKFIRISGLFFNVAPLVRESLETGAKNADGTIILRLKDADSLSSIKMLDDTGGEITKGFSEATIDFNASIKIGDSEILVDTSGDFATVNLAEIDASSYTLKNGTDLPESGIINVENIAKIGDKNFKYSDAVGEALENAGKILRRPVLQESNEANQIAKEMASSGGSWGEPVDMVFSSSKEQQAHVGALRRASEMARMQDGEYVLDTAGEAMWQAIQVSGSGQRNMTKEQFAKAWYHASGDLPNVKIDYSKLVDADIVGKSASEVAQINEKLNNAARKGNQEFLNTLCEMFPDNKSFAAIKQGLKAMERPRNSSAIAKQEARAAQKAADQVLGAALNTIRETLRSVLKSKSSELSWPIKRNVKLSSGTRGKTIESVYDTGWTLRVVDCDAFGGMTALVTKNETDILRALAPAERGWENLVRKVKDGQPLRAGDLSIQNYDKLLFKITESNDKGYKQIIVEFTGNQTQLKKGGNSTLLTHLRNEVDNLNEQYKWAALNRVGFVFDFNGNTATKETAAWLDTHLWQSTDANIATYLDDVVAEIGTAKRAADAPGNVIGKTELENLAKSGEWFDWSTPGMAKFVPIWSNVQRSVSSGVSPGQRKAGTGVAIHVAVRAIPAITGEDQEGNFAFFGGLQATSKSANINMAADGDFIIMDYKDVEELNQGNSEETGNNETERTFDDFGL